CWLDSLHWSNSWRNYWSCGNQWRLAQRSGFVGILFSWPGVTVSVNGIGNQQISRFLRKISQAPPQGRSCLWSCLNSSWYSSHEWAVDFACEFKAHRQVAQCRVARRQATKLVAP